jgi:hypothetical protein
MIPFTLVRNEAHLRTVKAEKCYALREKTVIVVVWRVKPKLSASLKP